MNKKIILKSFKISLLFGLFLGIGFKQAMAMSLDWKGGYKTEYVEIDKTSLTPDSRKSYLLNELHLSPTIIAADGFNVVTRFDLLPNQDARYANSQMGQIWGTGVSCSGANCSRTANDSKVLSQNQPMSSLGVSQLYLKIDQEFGTIVVGRAPVQFGLGITHNAGNGPFDHWFDTRDMVGYKVVIGNLFIMPSISKVYDNSPIADGEITDQTIHFEYDNAETGNLLGLFYETRTGAASKNDAPASTIGGSTAIVEDFKTISYNVIFGKKFEEFDFKIEGAFVSGNSGLYTAGGDTIKLNSYAVVGELNYKPEGSKSWWNIKAGSVSGDDPSTPNYEGYVLDRNYDVAFMMFNHPMGKSNILKSSLVRDSAFATPQNSLDDEGISNVFFVSPTWSYKTSDRWNIRNRITWAQLVNNNFIIGGTSENINHDVGLEYDFGFDYQANDRIQWRNEIGFLFPGKAWAGGSLGYQTQTAIGFQTGAAISF